MYHFLVETYETEILKVLTVWSSFHEDDLNVRPHPTDTRGRTVREQMIHQCNSEDAWFRNMFGIEIGMPPLPESETCTAFIRHYAQAATSRLAGLQSKDDAWWEQSVPFFGEPRSRAWIMVRRIAHTSHHRGQQMAMLRMLNREVYSNYGPTADTGGLAANQAKAVYAYRDLDSLIAGEPRAALPGRGDSPVSERGSGK